MPTLVHISSAENEKRIVHTGIKLGKYNGIIYFMPHTKDFLISHQWVRKLKRSGIKNFIAVDFKLKGEEKVWFGKYTESHDQMSLSDTISHFLDEEDKLGYEFFIERKINPNEILRTGNIPKPMFWRYEPKAHGKKPCQCPMCILRGGFKTNRIKEKTEVPFSRDRAKEIILASNDEDELLEAIIRLKGKWKKESPQFLKRLLDFEDEYLLYELVGLLHEYCNPLAKEYKEKLSCSHDEEVKELAIEYLEDNENRKSKTL